MANSLFHIYDGGQIYLDSGMEKNKEHLKGQYFLNGTS